MFHADGKVALRVKVGEISVAPAKGYKTLGEIAMLDGSVVVTAKEGMLRVTGNGSTVDVAKGKTITIAPQAQRAPAPAAGGASGASTALQVGSVAASTTSVVTSSVAISRAGDARDAAAAANATAAQAVSAANAATAAANAATAAANEATATANAVGCALDALEPITGVSPYQTDFGGTCD
jgi:hypothetical protein